MSYENQNNFNSSHPNELAETVNSASENDQMNNENVENASETAENTENSSEQTENGSENEQNEDENDQNEDETRENGSEAVETASQVVNSASQVASSASSAVSGDVGAVTQGAVQSAGSLGQAAISSALEGSGADRAAQAVNIASGAVAGVSGVASAAARGNAVGAVSQGIGAAGNVAGSAVGGAVGEAISAASEAVGAVSEAAGTLANVLGRAQDQQAENVSFYFEPEELSDIQWDVGFVNFTEGLSTPFEAEIHVRTEQIDAEPARFLGTNAVLLMERGDILQRCPGIISEVFEGNTTSERLSVHLKLVPALKLLEQKRDTRVFQEMTAPDILEQILTNDLGEYEREIRLELEREYPTREYCTQYDETTLDFVHRLMEEEGIVYFFDTDGDREILVLADSQQYDYVGSLNDETLLVRETQGLLEGHEYVTKFRVRSKMLPTKQSLSHYSWTTTPRTTSPADSLVDPEPLTYELEGVPAEAPELPKGEALGPVREHYDHDNRPLTIFDYDDDAGQFESNDVVAQTMLRRELQSRDGRVGEGTSTVIAVRPGLIFDLTGHRQPELDGRYLAVRVKHTFMMDGTDANEPYVNEFWCIPAGVPFRPDRKTVRPRITGLQTATVVGPDSSSPPDEIHTDQHGRVKVQFHWDRLGERNDHSSCFVRVMQPWAGANWGFVFIPRIGMEVTITFVNGDPDQPVVTGTLYNGVNHPPLTLDDEKTRSTIKTRSTPASDGYNELTFEDLAGEEQIIVHAQKDYNETVENDHSTTVHSNQTNSIDGNHSESVGGDQSLSVSGNRTKSVTGEETNSIDQKRETTVGGLEKDTFQASRETRITGTDLLEISDRRTEQINNGRRSTISAGDEVLLKTGNMIANVASGQYLVSSSAQLKLVQGGSHGLRLDGMAKLASDAEYFITSNATSIRGNAGGKLVVGADGMIQIGCGAASIVLQSDGTITLTGTKIEASGGGGGQLKLEAGSGELSGPGAKLNAIGICEVNGGLVKIG